MRIDEKVYAVLTADAPLLALVPADRIKHPGYWQKIDSPYIIHFLAGMEPLHTFSSLVSDMPQQYQVSVFGTAASQVTEVAQVVITALDGTHTISDWSITALFTGGQLLAMEADTGIHQFVLLFEIYGSRN